LTRLANTTAMRVVSRDSLGRVYEKMWARDGRKGDLLRFLGPPPPGPRRRAPLSGRGFVRAAPAPRDDADQESLAFGGKE
jgi:hypothetical protein